MSRSAARVQRQHLPGLMRQGKQRTCFKITRREELATAVRELVQPRAGKPVSEEPSLGEAASVER